MKYDETIASLKEQIRNSEEDAGSPIALTISTITKLRVQYENKIRSLYVQAVKEGISDEGIIRRIRAECGPDKSPHPGIMVPVTTKDGYLSLSHHDKEIITSTCQGMLPRNVAPAWWTTPDYIQYSRGMDTARKHLARLARGKRTAKRTDGDT